MPATTATQYMAAAAIGTPQVSPVSSSQVQVEQLLKTSGPSLQIVQPQILQNPQADMQAAAIPWRTPVAGAAQQRSTVNTGVNPTSPTPMITYLSSPANQQ